jgi:hypothetical protein
MLPKELELPPSARKKTPSYWELTSDQDVEGHISLGDA